MKQLKEKEYEKFQQYLYNKAHGYIWTPDTLELICGGNDNEPERIGKQMLEMLGRVRNAAYLPYDERQAQKICDPQPSQGRNQSAEGLLV